jgi:hypothetical protein
LRIEGVAWSAQRIPTAVNLDFLDQSRYFSIQVTLNYPREAEWTPFQTHYFTENLVALRIEPGTSGTLTTVTYIHDNILKLFFQNILSIFQKLWFDVACIHSRLS